jgi:uncharacterized membrane protein
MTDATIVPAARDYLDQLDAALVGVDASTRSDILAGVREVLVGRDAKAVAAQIRELGDPDFIAAEARTAPADGPETMPENVVRTRRSEPAGLAVVAAVLVMIGGALVPVLGAVVGYVLMWISTVWTTRQKLVATLAPVAVVTVFVIARIAISMLWPDPSQLAASSNPIMPAPFDLMWSGVVLVATVPFFVGVWLLVLARRSWAARP